MNPRALASLPVQLLQVALVGVLYFVAAKAGLLVALEQTNASPVWPPSGVALAALLLRGPSGWPGISLGAVAANALAFHHHHVASLPTIVGVSVGIAAGNTLEAVVGYRLVRRWCRGAAPFDRVRDAIVFTGIALLMCAVSAFVGPTTLCLSGITAWDRYATLWLTWWLGDLSGVLVFTPLLVAWGAASPSARRRPGHEIEAAALGLVLILITWIAFGGRSPITRNSLVFMAVPCLVWAALRFGLRGSASAIALVSGFAVWRTALGLGPFAVGSQNESLIVLQAFVCVITVTILLLNTVVTQQRATEQALQRANAGLEARVAARTEELARANRRLQAEVAERRLTETVLRQSEHQFRRLVESNIIGVILADTSGRIIEANDVFLNMVGYRRQELPIRWDEMTPRQYRELDDRAIEALKRDGEAAPWEKEYIRKDGTRVPVLVGVARLEDTTDRCVCFVLDLTERRRLEREILAAGDAQQRRIGQDLHDGLCQQLTGMALMAQSFARQLGTEAPQSAGRAAQLVQLINRAIKEARLLVKGLSPVDMAAGDLVLALKGLCGYVQELFGVRCVFEHDEDVSIEDRTVAFHLYRIAQEALSNAGKHSRATRVVLRLSVTEEAVHLSVTDNGVGLAGHAGERRGMGMRSMRYRADIIGATLEIQPGCSGGTTVCCALPARAGVPCPS